MKQRGHRHELIAQIRIPDSPERQKQTPIRKKDSPPKKPIQTQQLISSYNNQNYLKDELKKSQKFMKRAQRQAITQKMQKKQVKTHQLQSSQNQNSYLEAMHEVSHKKHPYVVKSIEQTLQGVGNKVQNDIHNKYKVHRKAPMSKDDLKQLQKVDKYRLLKIKNGQIKNKVGNLRQQLQKEYYSQKKNLKLPDFENVKNSDYYTLQNPRTIEASHFVNNLQQRRKMEKQKYQEYLQMKKHQQEWKKQKIKQRIKQQKQQKRKYLQYQQQIKLQKQYRDREQNKKKKQQYKQWSKMFQKQKPLYIRKEQQYIENFLIPEYQEKKQKLLQRKLQNRPIDFDSIKDHDARYMQFKKDDEIRKQAHLQAQRQRVQQNQIDQDNLYKGKFRLNVLQQMNQKYNQEDPRSIEKVKKARQIIYSDHIRQKAEQQRQKYLNLNSQRNKKQFKKRTRNINGSLSIDNQQQQKIKDPRKDGRQYLHFMHQLVKQKGIKKPKVNQSQKRARYPDYLSQVHQRRKSLSLNDKYQSQSYNLSNSNQIESLKARAQGYDQRLKRYQQRKKHHLIQQDQDADIEQQQLSAIRAKMNLLGKIN